MQSIHYKVMLLLTSELIAINVKIAKTATIFWLETFVGKVTFFIIVITSNLIEVWSLLVTTLAVLLFC